MALAKSLLALLLIVLGFSSIMCANAVPSTRSRTLMHENLANFKTSINSDLDGVEARHEKGNLMERKMADIELEDYPGSGANNRHTPKPQFKGCDDC